MNQSLSALRKAKGLSQEELGKAIALRLKRPIGISYAQKKISIFESGDVAPTAEEIRALATELDVDVDVVQSAIAGLAPHEAESIIGQFTVAGGRSLVASCILSRPRSKILDGTNAAIKQAVEENNVSVAVFVPYSAVVNLPETSDHTNHLVGEYAVVRKSILEANLVFKSSLTPARADAVALYVPKADANILIPPVLRQFSLTLQEDANGLISKSLHIWTPRTDIDAARPVKSTSVYTLEEQIEAWESFFGDVISHWVAKNEFVASDAYWKRVR